MIVTVYCTTQFEGWHRWADAPQDVQYSFLRDWHRHMFHVKVCMMVEHENRAIEFIQLKREVNSYLNAHFTGQRFELSCEMIAVRILRHFNAMFVEVSEDAENGSIVYNENLLHVILAGV